MTDTLPTELDATWTAAAGDQVWVNVGGTVVRVDPASGMVTGTVTVGDTARGRRGGRRRGVGR